jgi:hypothetical protein
MFSQLGDVFQDWYRQTFQKSASAHVLKHCRRELLHAIWFMLLDEEFMHAYTHGIVIEFPDGIKRRVFPRLFTYSMDYPEKQVVLKIQHKRKLNLLITELSYPVLSISGHIHVHDVLWINQKYRLWDRIRIASHAFGMSVRMMQISITKLR